MKERIIVTTYTYDQGIRTPEIETGTLIAIGIDYDELENGAPVQFSVGVVLFDNGNISLVPFSKIKRKFTSLCSKS